jgi:hypothetical protein
MKTLLLYICAVCLVMLVVTQNTTPLSDVYTTKQVAKIRTRVQSGMDTKAAIEDMLHTEHIEQLFNFPEHLRGH